MTTRRGVLAVGLVLSGFRTVGAEPCTPRAALAGDAAAIARVAVELERLGVAIDRDSPHAATAPRRADCRTIAAAVELDRGGGIAVAVRDAAHRSEGRVVSDAALAAAWIDSWLRDDFEAPAPLAAPLSPPTTVAPRADIVAVAAPAPVLERYSITASFEQAWSETSSRWSGVGIAACVHTGSFCLGARARYLGETVAYELTAAARRDLSVLATASWSRQIGQMTVGPELGLGAGMLSTARVDGCGAPPPCDPTDPMCAMQPPSCTSGSPNGAPSGPVYVGDGLRESTITPRAEAALRVAIPLLPHLWLDGTASVMLSPFAHGADAPTMVEPVTNVMPDQIALPAEPIATFMVGVGLRVAVP